MAEYVFCATHRFASKDDLRKRLEADKKDAEIIMPILTKAGMLKAQQWLRIDDDGIYCARGQFWFRDKAAHDKCMEILENHAFTNPVIPKSIYETYIVIDDINDL
jgi:hypothetical protein